ncbi:TadE family protein [Thermophilibacter provencensis]|uniref:Pilus assembly protein n=1 Tax=Thermophilibacter provencensis TaxID=1852386 RepID=A0ABT7V172_9ACTN|nr:TadE family protein [Thermophilibacter provencensis]MDM8270355.1 pilus assembly protein [Thermophilibacter provencensis]
MIRLFADAGWGTRGQMTVELAVVTPVVIVMTLIVFNLMRYVVACAAFDQAALDCVVAHGVAPSGEQSERGAVEQVRRALSEALEDYGSCEVDVRAEGAGSSSQGETFALSPLLTRYVCTLTYHPWPLSVRMPGITYGAPFALTHERSLIVDRYRPGVVV